MTAEIDDEKGTILISGDALGEIGEYPFTILLQGGNQDVSFEARFVIEDPDNSGLADNVSGEGFLVVGNPVVDQCEVYVPNAEGKGLLWRILSVGGIEVSRGVAAGGAGNPSSFTIRRAGLPAGMYILMVESNADLYQAKLILE